MLVGKRIHLRSESEVVGVLGAAMQHDDQWSGLATRLGA